jgi:soluble lytic murein transglycosylase-like protein
MRASSNGHLSFGRIFPIGCALFSSLMSPVVCVAESTSRAGLFDLSTQVAAFPDTGKAPPQSSAALDDRRAIDKTEQTAHSPEVCRAAGHDEYVALIRAHAEQNALPAQIAEAVTYVESRYHPGKIGKAGEIGLMQIRPATAAMLGFRGSYIELAEPATNIHYGVAYLARAWRLAHGDLCRALMKYRAGHRQEKMTLLSKKYCGLAKVYLASVNSPEASYGRSSASTSLISSVSVPGGEIRGDAGPLLAP